MEEILYYAMAILAFIGSVCGLYGLRQWARADNMMRHYKKLCQQQKEELDDLQDIKSLLEILSMREGA